MADDGHTEHNLHVASIHIVDVRNFQSTTFTVQNQPKLSMYKYAHNSTSTVINTEQPEFLSMCMLTHNDNLQIPNLSW